jgi:hypothetical protein
MPWAGTERFAGSAAAAAGPDSTLEEHHSGKPDIVVHLSPDGQELEALRSRMDGDEVQLDSEGSLNGETVPVKIRLAEEGSGRHSPG